MLKTLNTFVLFLLIYCVPFTSVSAEPANTPEGLEFCTVCHGSQLMGNANIAAPRLSDLPAWYVERQLLSFKSGLRGKHVSDVAGQEMQQMVTELSDEQITEIAEWVSQTESSLPEPTLMADAAAGASLYQGCGVCHGANAEGNVALGAPPLVGINDWYLKTQLEHFREGSRGSEPADLYGQQMRAGVALISTDEDVDNLIAYINELSTQ
jgi:cytochrome c oxidase subunit 2